MSDPTTVFRCFPLRARLRVETCVRQHERSKKAGFEGDSVCRECPDGKRHARGFDVRGDLIKNLDGSPVSFGSVPRDPMPVVAELFHWTWKKPAGTVDSRICELEECKVSLEGRGRTARFCCEDHRRLAERERRKARKAG